MAKSKDEQPQQTMEDFLLAQLQEEVILKDGTQLKAADGHVMTKQEAIATNLINLAMNRRCSGIKTANAKAVRSASNQARKIDSGSLAWPRALRYRRNKRIETCLFLHLFTH